MKIRCLIVDDEPLAHDVLLRYISDVPFLENAGQCYRATEALELLSTQEIDLIFLDIRMPKLSGLDFLRTLQKKPVVIITSAYEQHALESFDLDVCDYLLKPFGFERFLKASNRALARLSPIRLAAADDIQNQEPAATSEPARICLKSDKKFVMLELEKIYYLESLGNYVKVWQESGFILTPRTLSSFESQLPGEDFIRIHKSYILNKRFVHYVEGNTLRLKNGKELSLGKNYKHVLKTLLTNFRGYIT